LDFQKMIQYGQHDVTDADIAAVSDALKSGTLTGGAAVHRFEAVLRDYLQDKMNPATLSVTACNNGTAALILAYQAIGIKPGDEVIVPEITFAATATAAMHLGATIVIADCNARTGLISPSSVKRLITPRTRAIVPVHLAGRAADMKRLWMIRDYHNTMRGHEAGIYVIEDCAHALGARYNGTSALVGTSWRSSLATFSFHPVKHITTGEGGAVVGGVLDRYLITALRNHGIRRAVDTSIPGCASPWDYDVTDLAWNFRLSDINAALGTSQLARHTEALAARLEIAHAYNDLLSAVVNVPEIVSGHAWHIYQVQLKTGVDRAAVMRRMYTKGVMTQIHYKPLSQLSILKRPTQPNAQRFYDSTLTLPCYPSMTEADISHVVKSLKESLCEL
jgi:dTDP-4-amino-4,6-dideoxygalactose transaminase